MHLLHNECDHPGKSSMQFLPMIDMNPGEIPVSSPHWITYANLLQGTTCQPLWHSTSLYSGRHMKLSTVLQMIVPLEILFCCLDFSHSHELTWSNQNLMDGTRLKDILEIVYGENVIHMMSGKAVQQAFQGHLLIDQGLTGRIVSLIMTDDRSFEDQMIKLETLYLIVRRSNWHWDDVEVWMYTCTWRKSCRQKRSTGSKL